MQGQKRVVFVHQLLIEDSVDELVYEALEKTSRKQLPCGNSWEGFRRQVRRE